MKNRRNIIESELPPQNPLDIWMKDGKLYRSTNKGWVLIEDQMEFTNSELMSKSTATSGTIGVNKETGKASIYNDVTKEWNSLGGGMTETTWQELKDKRDNGQLIPGSLYRIIDYNCTTTQENTQSAGHQFDIVLLALSENKLAEEGWAMESDVVDMLNDFDLYTITFTDGISKKYYLKDNTGDELQYSIIDAETFIGNDLVLSEIFTNLSPNTKTGTMQVTSSEFTEMCYLSFQYNYFQNSNLSAWKVWYCLDNDKDRFAWADDSVDEDSPASITVNNVVYVRDATKDVKISNKQYYGWINNNTVLFTRRENNIDSFTTVYERRGNYMVDLDNVNIGTYTPAHEGTGLPNGRGVIYRLIDEWGNDVCFDFKNIQHYIKQHQDTGYYDNNGTYKYVYTFNIFDVSTTTNIDGSSEGQRFIDDDGNINHTVDNVIKVSTVSKNDEIIVKCIPETIFMSQYAEGTGGTRRNTIENSSVIISNYSIYDNYLKDCNHVKITSAVGNTNSYLYCMGTISTRANMTMFIGNKKVSTES